MLGYRVGDDQAGGVDDEGVASLAQAGVGHHGAHELHVEHVGEGPDHAAVLGVPDRDGHGDVGLMGDRADGRGADVGLAGQGIADVGPVAEELVDRFRVRADEHPALPVHAQHGLGVLAQPLGAHELLEVAQGIRDVPRGALILALGQGAGGAHDDIFLGDHRGQLQFRGEELIDRARQLRGARGHLLLGQRHQTLAGPGHGHVGHDDQGDDHQEAADDQQLGADSYVFQHSCFLLRGPCLKCNIRARPAAPGMESSGDYSLLYKEIREFCWLRPYRSPAATVIKK